MAFIVAAGFDGTPEPVEAIATVCTTIEVAGVLLALRPVMAGARRTL